MESGGGVVQAPPVDSEGVEPPTSALSGHWIVQCDELRVTASQLHHGALPLRHESFGAGSGFDSTTRGYPIYVKMQDVRISR